MLIWYFKRDYKKEPSPEYGSAWRYFKIWPLFQSEWDDRGNFSFNCVSLWPFRDPDGYEKLYQPFWTIMEYRRMQTGEKRLGFLLRLYYQRWSNDFLFIKIPVLFSYSKSHECINKLSFTDFLSIFCYNNDKGGSYLSLIFSMFGYNNDKDGKYIRLFWIPINFGEKQLSKNDNELKEPEKELFEQEYIVDASPAAGSVFFAGNDAVIYKMRVF